MKFKSLPVRRKPVRKTLYSRLFNKAKKRPKRQRASAATADADEMEHSGINIARSLSIIFVIHILAIVMVFVHNKYLSDRTPAPQSVAQKITPKVATPAAVSASAVPSLSSGDITYMVRQGDNYAIIAEKHNVAESDLRNLNRGADIRAGVVLRIPQAQRIVAEDPPEVAALRNRPAPSASERGLVEIAPPVDESPSQVARPVTRSEAENAPRARVVGSGRTHTIKAGENIWRISNKYKVNQQELMELNNITDPTKLKIGQILKLP